MEVFFIKTRVVLSILLLLTGFMIIPQFIIFLSYFKEYTIAAPGIFYEELDFMGNLSLLFYDREFLILWLCFQPVFLVLIILVFWKDKFFSKRRNLNQEFGTPEQAGAGQYGTSRWMTRKEMDSLVTTWQMKSDESGFVRSPEVLKNPYAKTKKELKERVVGGGNVLGMDLTKLKVWIDTDDTNTLIIGTSRSGKTRTFLFPTIWELGKTGESMILTDPKGEIHELTHTYLKQQGYNVILLDFRDPRRGNHWNVMEPVNEAIKQGDEAKASEAASDIAHSIVFQTERKGDQVWANGEKSVIEATILALAISNADEEQKNMANVYQNIIELGQPKQFEDERGRIFEEIPLNEYFKSLPAGNIAKNAFGVASLSPEKMRGSFFSSAASSLRLFSDPSLSFMTKKQDHDMRSIGIKPTIVFLCIPDEKTTKHILASLYVNQVYEALVEEANSNGGRLKNRVNMLLDEFGNMPSVPDFDTKVTVSLGRGIRWTMIIQDLQQLKKRYGDNSLTITGNCHTWIYLLTTDQKTAEEISKKTGVYTVETESRSSSVQERGSSRSVSEGLTKRPLLTADEILRWPVEKSLILMARHFPATLPLPDISRWEFAMQELNKTIVKGTKVIVPSKTYLFNQSDQYQGGDQKNELDNEPIEDNESNDLKENEEQKSEPRGIFATIRNQNK